MTDVGAAFVAVEQYLRISETHRPDLSPATRAQEIANLLATLGIIPPNAAACPAFITPDFVARRFHEHYERLAPSFGYETREASAVVWEDVPADNKALMLAVACNVMDDLQLPTRPDVVTWHRLSCRRGLRLCDCQPLANGDLEAQDDT